MYSKVGSIPDEIVVRLVCPAEKLCPFCMPIVPSKRYVSSPLGQADTSIFFWKYSSIILEDSLTMYA